MENTVEIPYEFIGRLSAFPFVESIRLFGSRARGDNGARADIDLAVSCPGASSIDWERVMTVIDDADTLLKIDCVRFDTLTAADPLRETILREGMLLFRRNDR